jgi:amino acid transporter
MSDDRKNPPGDGPEETGTTPAEQEAEPESRWQRVPKSGRTQELEWKEVRRGQKPGERIVRVVRPHSDEFRHPEPGHLIVTEKATQPRTAAARVWLSVKRRLIGRPLATAMSAHERLTKVKALAVLSSDALSSSAYGTEQIVLILALAGTGALMATIPISIAIVSLLAIVAISYRQTIKAYPGGGGSYIVTKDNLGTIPALTAAASLMVDYTLTVAVSISAGIAALTSAVPALLPYNVWLAMGALTIILVVNLRGIRESGTIFAAPTYMFITAMMIMIAVGLYHTVILGETFAPPPIATTQTLGIFLLLRAFASGCSALTGMEAISDGVPAFKPPEAKNARTTLATMAIILGIMFMGVSILASQFGIAANPAETVLSQIGRHAFGTNALYYFLQASTMLILVLAANTSFSDFPRLSYFVARDKFLPSQFAQRGDRLAYSTGMITLTIFASILIIVFKASTDALIPLYAIGVFVSFTLSQSSMVTRWWRRKERGWKRSMIMNAAGAIATGIVAVVIMISKAPEGAWIVMVLIPVMVFIFWNINRHYTKVRNELIVTPVDVEKLQTRTPRVIVPVGDLDQASIRTMSFASSISPDVTAVHVTDDPDEASSLRRQFARLDLDTPLVILESPYRVIVAPLLRYIDAVHEQDPLVPITVVLSQLIPKHIWEYPLHYRTGLRLRAGLYIRPNVVVIDLPYHLKS